MDILGKVDDEKVFKNFDWSTFFYTRLLNSLKTILQGKNEAYELKRAKSSKVVAYYNIKGYILAFHVWTYRILSTTSEHLATKNSKGSIPRILRWNCPHVPSYKMLQKNIFDNKNTVVQAKLKPSTQEKAFMESRIQGDDNMEMEDDESMPDINNNDNTTPDDTTNNQSLDKNNLQLTSSPQLSPPKKKRQTVADESEMHPMTKKKSRKSNDKKQKNHSKSYKTLKKNIKEVHKDVSALTSIVCRMDDRIRKQSLELSEMKQILKRLLQKDQEESGSDISIDGRDADLLLTIRDISDNLNAQSQKEKYLPEMITTLPLVSQPLPLCEILRSSSSTLNQPAMAPLDQTVKIQEVPPSISIVNEESQLEIQNNDQPVTLAEIEKENEQVTEKQTIGNEQQSTSTERIESQLVYTTV
ncbi:Ulp1-like peptidase [Cucumis melo var. makuwa]|uniref:Ulp1-like peptidase n=1 Tax=Cucumis melo var. makuwa TaxID=1194695 RepID=A0A5D3DXA5_CUCMM|nr:Ulp1-like peptidase [Cucumis melo var. makuwa]TYK28058.1 Ulp1-like peptidase [Cucumis melo var. makuwa]